MVTKSFSFKKSLVAGSLLAGVLFFSMMFGVASAQVQTQSATVAELQALITQLMAQLAAMQGGGGSVAPGTGGTCVAADFSRTLNLGSRDALTNGDVTRLQQYLTTTGHYTYGQPTGFYGPATAEAVQRWQRANAVVMAGTPDTTGFGMLGPATRAKMRTSCTTPVPVTPPITQSPNLTITAPRPGTEYEVGQYVTLRWNSHRLTDHTGVVTLTGPTTGQAVERYVARGVDLGDGQVRVRIPASDTLGTVTEGAYTLALSVVDVKDGAPEDITARVNIAIVEEADETPTTSCLSGGVSYPEGTTRTTIVHANGTSQTIADAHFVCRGGVWETEGGLPRPASFTLTTRGLTADLTLSLSNGCAGYVVLWGDGTNTTRLSSANGTVCTQVVTEANVQHTYARGGTYTVTLNRYNGQTRTSSESRSITVAAAPVVETGTYIGYLNGAQFIVTRDSTRAEALTNCERNAASNPTDRVHCTWNGTIIFDNRTASTEVPGENHFACDRSVSTKIANGRLGCYGIWDSGDDFGNDADMCGIQGEGKLGCVIAAPVCSSGSAKATAYFSGRSIPSATMTVIASNLETTAAAVTQGVAGLWEYTCVAPETDVATTAPGVNHFSCGRTVATKIANGTLGCYGMWDYGDQFGGDTRVCGTLGSGTTGCTIKTPVCSSGSATVSRYISNADLSGAVLDNVAARLKVTTGVAKAGVAGLWAYTCAPAPAAVLGVSISQDSVLDDLATLLRQLATVLK
jgi:peptidoglycan hydrolase-like protein with peptidoglycan-binding domain